MKKSGSGEEWQPVTGAESRAVTSPNHEAEIVNQKRGGTISSQVSPPGTYFLQQGCLSLKDPQPSPNSYVIRRPRKSGLLGWRQSCIRLGRKSGMHLVKGRTTHVASSSS